VLGFSDNGNKKKLDVLVVNEKNKIN